MATTEDPAPKSTLPYPPLHKDKKFVVLSDWDAFREMLESVSGNGHSFEFCKEELKKSKRQPRTRPEREFDGIHPPSTDIVLDAGFKDFYRYCKRHDVPIVIISSGMAPIIRAVLSNLIGEEDSNTIEIVSNEVEVHEDGTWSIKYRHPTSGFGHDKSQAILPYRALPEPPLIFFFGDGVSDMSAARHADVLFVKEKPDGENDLAAYCVREGIPHILFADFGRALAVVADVVEGRTSAKQALDRGRAD
ncbi:hypothetical protein GSI_07698 [Ganoderma sinense ZZ0214-1]|uniref:Uncharacterized protein n=1 Tax=Ganoderma sinense ZZ0214-1 TaxID=1077348 RepID=A0A2G8S8N2_9APHY|nr:hypothetical protein GSI_07698 [Ganoderma sinense ZZ0214-1]